MGLFSVRRTASACVISAAAVAALAAPGAASAATQCSGSNIIAAGSTLQKLAQVSVWDPGFHTSANATACNGSQGSKGEPTISYESIGSGAGLEDWGFNSHAFEAGRVAVVATDEPVNLAQKAEIEKNETTKVANSVQSIPVLQASVAIIVNLPSGCTASNGIKKNPWPGRLVIENETLQKIWVGSITKWSEIKEEGDKLTGATCNPETPITRVVRLDGSGTTHVFKKYLTLINGTGTFEVEKLNGETVTSETWNEISEGAENTSWPAADHVVRSTKTGGGALVSKVAETPGSIGYANLADARANGGFSAAGSGPETAKFWAPIQNNGLTVVAGKAKFADPSTDGDTEPLAKANCESTSYTNGKGQKFPPKLTADAWNSVTTSTKEKKYAICGLTYDMVLSKYSAYPGTSEGEATTAENFLTYVLETGLGGGQVAIGENHDYEPLPTKLLKEARAGAALAKF
jgi:ABC-type phosphate transport system substrate-binding protein